MDFYFCLHCLGASMKIKGKPSLFFCFPCFLFWQKKRKKKKKKKKERKFLKTARVSLKKVLG